MADRYIDPDIFLGGEKPVVNKSRKKAYFVDPAGRKKSEVVDVDDATIESIESTRTEFPGNGVQDVEFAREVAYQTGMMERPNLDPDDFMSSFRM